MYRGGEGRAEQELLCGIYVVLSALCLVWGASPSTGLHFTRCHSGVKGKGQEKEEEMEMERNRK